MIEFLWLLLLVGVCIFVVLPILQKRQIAQMRLAESDMRVSQLLHQQRMVTATIEDLDFDFQTGKLSQKDYEALKADQHKIQTDANKRLKDISGLSQVELMEKLEKEIEETKRTLVINSSAKCPTCQSPIQKDDKFCSECGAKLR